MSFDHPGTDRKTLTQRAYATDEKLGVRQRTHELYTVPQTDFKNWVLDRITWHGDERVLDVGAGPGAYFGPVKARIPDGQHFAGDLSLGMVRQQRANRFAAGSGLLNMDAQALPFPDASFDVVLANHMLYHVPDLDAALREIKRVLRPTGVLVAATNSAGNMPELRTLFRRAVLLLTSFTGHGKAELVGGASQRFSLEDAPQRLARHFYAVARYDLPSALVFPEVGPVLDYLESLRDLREDALPAGISWERFMDVVRQQVTSLIEHAGKLMVNKLTGVLVATDEGDFAGQYVAILKQNSFEF